MSWILPSVVVLYLTGAIIYGLIRSRRSGANADEFLTGGRSLGPALVGFTLASQFMGPGNIVGVAEEAFKRGTLAGWAMISLGLAFLILSAGLAGKYHQSGYYTTSDALASTFGPAVKQATAAVLVVALSGVSVAVYVAGASVISLLVKIPYAWAVVLCGSLVGGGVALGGMRYLAHANLVHTACSLLGCGLGAWYGIRAAGGFTSAATTLPPGFLDFFGIAPTLFMGWFLANLGAVGSTQTVVQILGSAASPRTARLGALLASLVLAVAGMLSALAGVSARVAFPQGDPTAAYPMLVSLMPPAMGGVVVAGLVGGLFATASGCTLAVSTLLLKDFYVPYFRPAGGVQLATVGRWLALAAGLLPIPFALAKPGLFPVTFLGRALRATLFAVVVAKFYVPFLTRGKATWAIGLGAAATVAWFLAGSPLGIDNVYISLLVPVAVLALTRRAPLPAETAAPAVSETAQR